ncbi:Transcription elongation factor A protein 2 [Trichinella pseudospiralis]|uniref:Transcription elongation factor n=1 Tax=Trichinella pseudospiralis TaxID=6337 RepID=A0A0V1FRE7_TRIPS|nr:Transcription elongation factor A protein 2 [Trichinella pseudospiralis]
MAQVKAREDDLIRYGKKLDRVVNGEKSEQSAMDILRILRATPMTVELLQKTRIGMTVNELRKKTTDRSLQVEAKNLIRHWKKLIECKSASSKSSNAASSAVTNSVNLPRNDSVARNMSEGGRSNDSDGMASTPSRPRSIQKNTTFPAQMTDVREKCRQMLLKSLEPDLNSPEASTLNRERLAAEIEQEIYNLFNSTSDRYCACVRSRVFNLRDKKNPDLKRSVLSGEITAIRLATMTSEEMASEALKAARRKFTKEAIEEHQVAQEVGTPTDMFKCGKCHKKNCTYTQAQTRSADEPMTTFVYCRECGNRWKFC